MRRLDRAPRVAEIRDELARYRPESVIEAAAAAARRIPPLILSRIVRELVADDRSGSRRMTAAEFGHLAGKVGNMADPETVALLAAGRFHDVGMTRLLTDQLPFHSDYVASMHRTINVMLDHEGNSPLSSASWERRLGLALPNVLIGGLYFLTQAERGVPFDVAAYRLLPSTSDHHEIIEGTLSMLARTVADLRTGRTTTGGVYDLGPLASTPLVWIDRGRLVAPSPKHIPLAIGTVSFYLRLIREDAAERSRERSTLVGHRFERHVHEYAAAALTERWVVRRLDDEPPTGKKVADIAIWPDDRSFLIVIETKASLASVDAQLGDVGGRLKAEQLYQKSFDQIRDTVLDVGRGSFLEDAPVGVPVLGLTVTLENHLTSVIDGRTYFGLVLDYREPGDAGAFCDDATCRVLNADNIEQLIDSLALLSSSESLRLLQAIAEQPTPLVAVPAALQELGFHQRLAQADANPAIRKSLSRLRDGIVDPQFRAAIDAMVIRS